MTISVGDIAALAFSAVSGAISGVIKGATLTRTIQGAYTTSTGVYATTTQTSACRVTFADDAARADAFPEYVAGPNDRMVFVEGASFAPRESDEIAIGASSFVVTATADIAGAGQFFSAIVRGAA